VAIVVRMFMRACHPGRYFEIRQVPNLAGARPTPHVSFAQRGTSEAIISAFAQEERTR
jgi:hypothetical protein